MSAPVRNPFATTSAAALRYAAVKSLIHEFFKQEVERQHNLIQDLIRRNVPFTGYPNGFVFQDRWFSNFKGRPPRPMPVLNSSLFDEALLLIQVERRLEDDTNRMRRSLGVLFNRCDTTQAFRDALPEPLVHFLPSVRGLPRTQEAGSIVAEHPALAHDFKTLLDIVFYYEANRLVF